MHARFVQGRELTFVFQQIWGSLPCTGTYYTRHQAPRAQRHIWTVPVVTATLSGRHFRRLMYKFYGAWWPRVASWRSWFREIHVPQAWRVYLITGPDFREKNRACFGSIGSRVCCQSPTLPLYYEGKMIKTIFPQNYVYVLRTTTIRHMVSFMDFYFHFLANFQA